MLADAGGLRALSARAAPPCARGAVAGRQVVRAARRPHLAARHRGAEDEPRIYVAVL